MNTTPIDPRLSAGGSSNENEAGGRNVENAVRDGNDENAVGRHQEGNEVRGTRTWGEYLDECEAYSQSLNAMASENPHDSENLRMEEAPYYHHSSHNTQSHHTHQGPHIQSPYSIQPPLINPSPYAINSPHAVQGQSVSSKGMYEREIETGRHPTLETRPSLYPWESQNEVSRPAPGFAESQPILLPDHPSVSSRREGKTKEQSKTGTSKVTKPRTRRARKPAPIREDTKTVPRHVSEAALKKWGEKQAGPEYGGTIFPATRPVPIKPAVCIAREAKGIYEKYECPICHAGFERRHGVYTHFGPYVRLNGNPLGWKWNDDPSCGTYRGRSNEGLYNTDRPAWRKEKERNEEKMKMLEAECLAKELGKSAEMEEEDDGVPYILGYKGGVLPEGRTWKKSSLMLIEACVAAGSDVIYRPEVYGAKDFRAAEKDE